MNGFAVVSNAGAGLKKSALVRGWEMDGLRVDVEIEECEEFWDDWRGERWGGRISWDFLVWLIARCGMEGAVLSVDALMLWVGCLLLALSK